VVVLESGIAASSVSWALVRDEVAKFATVVSYDRAGFGYSRPPEHKCTAADAARDLANMLQETAPGPYVLVGHSFGGLIVRRYQQDHPELVAGMVLLDPVIRGEWRNASGRKKIMLGRGVMLSRRGAWMAQVGIVGFALQKLLSGSNAIPKMMARASAGGGSGVAVRLANQVKKLPRELWPVMAEHWSKAQSFRTMADYLENLPLSVTQLDEQRTLGDLPITILTAETTGPDGIREHAWDSRLSRLGRHRIVTGSGHWLQLDQPAEVIAAVREVCQSSRSKSSMPSTTSTSGTNWPC